MKPKTIHRSPGNDSGDSFAPWEGVKKPTLTSQPRVQAVSTPDRAPGTNTLNRLGVLPEAKKFVEADRFKPPTTRPPRPTAPPPPRQTIEAEGPPAADEEFWSLDAGPAERPVAAEPHEYLSGPSHLFDPATGWDFSALSDEQVAAARAARNAAPAPGAPPRSAPAPGIPADGPMINLQPAAGAAFAQAPPKVARVSPEEGVARARDMMTAGQDEAAVELLEQVDKGAPGDSNVQTWLEYGVRRLMQKHCPGATPDKIPSLSHSLDKLAAVASEPQAAILGVIDGQSNLLQVRAASLGLSTAAFWLELGKLRSRGWVHWH